jgi:hypothetical protein
VLDVFDGRNVIAAWVPAAVLVATGLAAARRTGALLGAGLCAVSLAVIVATNAIPGYQRDDWRGAAEALPRGAEGRVIVGAHNSAAPLSVYLGALRAAPGETVRAREIVFVVLRTRHTGRSPSAPQAPSTPPAGFRAAAGRSSEAFAVSRFLAPRPTAVRLKELRAIEGEPQADVALER